MLGPASKYWLNPLCIFSKNATVAVKEMVSRELERVAVHSQSKYLGLPLVVGYSKTQVFSFVEEAARTRINSWKNKFLSTAGREMLLKSVIMSLPIYAMSFYKLPK